MPREYWSGMLNRRIARRHALVATGGASLAGAALLACGSSGSSSRPAGDKGGLIDQPVDTTASAKSGGIIKDFAPADAVHFDAVASNAAGVVNFASAFAYPRMLRFATPKYPTVSDSTLEGEVAEAHEVSGDKVQLTFKVRQGMKWDARPPTSGRAIDAQDVVFSWNKFIKLNPSAGNMSASNSPAAPVESVTAPDNRTIVVKLKAPDSSLLPLFASFDHFYVMPRESDGGFDPRNTIRGHGPWILEEHVPSLRFVWAKNRDYFIKGRPFADKLERPIITEYASRLAQFKTGNIYTSTSAARDIIGTKRDAPRASIRQESEYSTTIWRGLSFGYEGNSPFKDVRVRQAVSMLVDREAYVDVIDNRDGFVKEGLDVPIAHNSIIAAGWNNYWLDPKDEKKFGANHKYLKHDVAEAKKLLSAAGHANGFDYDMFFSTTVYDSEYRKSAELYAGMLLDGGIKAQMRGLPYEQFKDIYYEAYFGPSYTSGKTKGFNGVVHLANPSLPTAASHLFTFVHKDGGRYHGLTPTGRDAHLGDPKLNSDIDKIKAEYDRERQVAMVHDLIRYFTGQAYYILKPGQVKPMSVIWPALANYGVYMSSPGRNVWAETNLQWWIDTTKAPLAGA